MNFESEVLYLDTRHLKCPILFVKTKQWLKKLEPGQRLQLLVKDRSGIKDIQCYLDKHQYDYSLTTDGSENPDEVEFTIGKIKDV